jgi:hypothetical protein
LGKYVSATVDTEAKHADIHVLHDDLDSALLGINVTSYFIVLNFSRIYLSCCLQKIVKHSKSIDKLLRASLKWIYKAQDFEDELGWD